jgi:hypothetical protein
MYALREALNAFRRAPMLTGLSSAMVGLALFVVGLFGLATYNLQLALTTIEDCRGSFRNLPLEAGRARSRARGVPGLQGALQ